MLVATTTGPRALTGLSLVNPVTQVARAAGAATGAAEVAVLTAVLGRVKLMRHWRRRRVRAALAGPLPGPLAAVVPVVRAGRVGPGAPVVPLG